MALNRERLKELSKLLKSVKLGNGQKFNMGTFVDVEVIDLPKVKPVMGKGGKVETTVLEEGFCETSACVLGYAALHPSFQKKGLDVEFDEDDNAFMSGSVVLKSGGKRYEGFIAGEKFFGLNDNQSNWLFNGPWETPKEAAAAIDRLLSNKLTHFDKLEMGLETEE